MGCVGGCAGCAHREDSVRRAPHTHTSGPGGVASRMALCAECHWGVAGGWMPSTTCGWCGSPAGHAGQVACARAHVTPVSCVTHTFCACVHNHHHNEPDQIQRPTPSNHTHQRAKLPHQRNHTDTLTRAACRGQVETRRRHGRAEHDLTHTPCPSVTLGVLPAYQDSLSRAEERQHTHVRATAWAAKSGAARALSPTLACPFSSPTSHRAQARYWCATSSRR
jgi:hypothetical protein